MYACRVPDHRVQAALLLVVVDDCSLVSSILSDPDLILEAANTSHDKKKIGMRRTPASSYGGPIALDGRAGVDRIGNVQSSTDPRATNWNSEAGRGVEEGEGEGLGAEVNEGGGGVEEGGEGEEEGGVGDEEAGGGGGFGGGRGGAAAAARLHLLISLCRSS